MAYLLVFFIRMGLMTCLWLGECIYISEKKPKMFTKIKAYAAYAVGIIIVIVSMQVLI